MLKKYGALLFILLLLTSCSNIERVKWREFSNALLEQEESDKPIMFFFYSTSCMYCKMMEKSTLNNREISEIINKNFIPIKLNVDNKLPLGKDLPSPSQLAATFRVKGVPAIFFVNKEHKIIKTVTGFQPVFLFKKHLNEALSLSKEE
ncbi:conserved hypothetical protein [Thermotomaculum hydrothermale]|uniref:Thioredoxin domain-containing protein n=1 Tax=Thermotomaculum hydrothermale TaxID=981385 RepID=A0A7R6T0D5_9BACT|nr:thioredoxin family protein [Thermotomaculum hydrothermale]BBB33630.1 conserved hypothetical protein [Thermotomaculum hydrothermale]